MQPIQDKYPVFEANQVLTSGHLNQIFNYLDEQERLTRANLIGIGIVCGLEIRLETTATAATIHLSRGCGVTSEGYLIVEPSDVALVSYRAGYKVPNEVDYPTFKDKITNVQYPLWELFPAGEPDTTPLASPANFLNDKAVLLFLELKKGGLRNCSPNDCNDKGSEVEVTVRRLLIGIEDLKKIIAAANELATNLTFADLESALLARLNLPDLRLPRYDVPNTGPVTSNDVLAAFLEVFQVQNAGLHLSHATADALSKAYNAFKPLLIEDYPSDPFANFLTVFGFLDDAPTTTTQVRFLQYYYDFFSDLLRAYDEFRWKGVELMCACCPPEGLFPRHLMLGVLFPNAVTNPSVYRHHFLASSAISGCEERTQELVLLFRRLVEMIARFTNTPPLPAPSTAARTDVQIRITPNKLADVPLSDKAIPYYYLQNGAPPLFQLWNAEKTRRNRANQNLSYRSDEYVPTAPAFVTNALRYDLEPYNFLQIEGHLGKNYQTVLNTLLTLKTQYRLPIEVIALRTGAFDENMEVDLSTEDCRFQDLEALYQAKSEALRCFLCKETQYFYDLKFEIGSKITVPSKPTLPILVECAPNFMVQPQTLGRMFEDWLADQPGGAIPDIDPAIIINFLNTQNLSQTNIIVAYVIIYLSKLYEQIPLSLAEFDFTNFEKRHNDLVLLTKAVELEKEQAVPNIENNTLLMEWEELDDRLEAILYKCYLAIFRSIHEEYVRRVREVKQKQFLSYFLRNNPGIQHKAGVPLGGTFILVYHDDPEPIVNARPFFPGSFTNVATNLTANIATANALVANPINPSSSKINPAAVRDALTRIRTNPQLAVDPDVNFIIGSFTGQAPNLNIVLDLAPPGSKEVEEIINQTVNELSDGTVIADFFLPYICCSDCSPVQFVLPKIPPTFTLQIGCTNPNGQSEVTIAPEGGMAPYSVKIDSNSYQPLSGPILLGAGPHTITIRDAEATESVPQTIQIAQPLTLSEPNYDCVGDANEYVAVFTISGGTSPYTANRGTVNGNSYFSDALPGGEEIEIIITDSRQCKASRKLRHSCLPPLAFTVQIGCTDANNTAQVLIQPTGGKSPYEAQVGTTPFAPITGPLPLQAGSHVITVRDDEGTVTAPQTIAVAPPLVLSVADLACEGTGAYRAFIRILGGAPPYIANGVPVTGNMFVTDPVPSGTVVSVSVIDQNKCTAQIETQHVCQEPCDKPCDGVSRQCAYRLWLQPPASGATYERYSQESAVLFRFNGEEIPLEDTGGILQIPTAQLNGDFKNSMGAAVKILNERVNQALVKKFGPDLGNNRLAVSYEPTAGDPFGVMRIEYFVCETFTIEFTFSFAKPTPGFMYTIRYTNEVDVTGLSFNGAIFINRGMNNKETRVPAFDCSERNQCSDTPFKKLCEGPNPKTTVAIESSSDNFFIFSGNVTPPNLQVIAWIWDPLTSRPMEAFYEGKTAQAQLQKPGGLLRLTAITNNGCFSITDTPVK